MELFLRVLDSGLANPNDVPKFSKPVRALVQVFSATFSLESINHLRHKLTKMGSQNRFGLLTAKRLESGRPIFSKKNV
jgi:hypothetical protein